MHHARRLPLLLLALPAAMLLGQSPPAPPPTIFWSDLVPPRPPAAEPGPAVPEPPATPAPTATPAPWRFAREGEVVRLPGYTLALKKEGDLMKEFLLVPYVGACIHVPPPPPGQIVLIRSEEGVYDEGLFTPIWATGRLRTKTERRELFLVDGAAEITSGYVMEPWFLAPYLPGDDDPLAAIEPPEVTNAMPAHAMKPLFEEEGERIAPPVDERPETP
jgi:hypothetical protein